MTTVASSDERVRKLGLLGQLLKRPELGAVAGTVLVIVFFAITAGTSGLFSAKGIVNFLEVSAQLGILAAAAALLMIAGEFDLSIGSMIGFAGIVIGIARDRAASPSGRRSLLAFAVAMPGRLSQRPDRREDRPAVLHRHAGGRCSCCAG